MKETIEKIRQEVENLERVAKRLKELSYDMPAIKKNVEAILTFIYILKYITPPSHTNLTSNIEY